MKRAPSFTDNWQRAFAKTAHGAKVDGLTPTAVAVGFVLSEYADWTSGTRIRPGIARVAETIGTAPATVKRCIAALIAADWLALESRGTFGRASQYRLSIPPLVHPTTGEVTPPRNGLTSEPVGSGRTARNGLTGVPLTGSPVSHQPWGAIVRALGSAA